MAVLCAAVRCTRRCVRRGRGLLGLFGAIRKDVDVLCLVGGEDGLEGRLFFADVLWVVEVDDLGDAVEEVCVAAAVLHDEARGEVCEHAHFVEDVEAGLFMVGVEFGEVCGGTSSAFVVA